ncbi:MAG: hypothetical protein U1F43_03315 [Myxococcota bacterium]
MSAGPRAPNGNWFIGWPLDARPWLDALTPVPRGARLFHPDDIHATVAFFGACGEARALAVWADVATTAATLAPTTFGPGPLRPFGNPRRPSAFAVEPTDGAADLCAFIGEHRERWLAAAGARPDDRAPRAHATLARPLRSAGPEEYRALAAWARAQVVPEVGLAVTRLALFTWSDERRERLFRIVAEVALENSAPRT